jgi:O-antigen/teichoic acid export membrane protein
VKVPALVMTGAVLAQVAGLLVVVPVYGALGAAIVSAGASALAALLLAWYCKDLGLAPARLPRYGLALALLAVPTLLLTWLLKDQSRIIVALWVTGSLALYGASIFALNLMDAKALAESASLPRSGPLGQVIRRVLQIGILLNNMGGRNPSRD